MRTVDFLRDNAGWLGAGALLTFLSSFGQTFFISIFAQRIMADFDLTEGQWSVIYGVGTTLSAILMVRAGSLTDRFYTRTLGVFVLAGLSMACLAMALNPFAGGLFVVVLMLRFFGQGMASHAAVVAMARWFVATRGRALAVCTLGITLGEMVFPITFVALMGWMDWRILWFAAALVAALSIPLFFRLLRTERHPRQVSSENQSEGMRNIQWSRGAVLRHPLFWLLVPALLGPSAFNTAFFFHHVNFAGLKGWSHLELVMFFPIYTAMAVIAMILSGWAIDRWGTARTMPFYQLPMVGAYLCFALGQGGLAIFFGFLLLAVTTGANSTIPNAFWAEFYGTRHIGAIKAMAAAIMVLGSAIGPGITGLLIDAGVRLDTQYVYVAAYFLLTTVAMSTGIRLYRGTVPSYRDFRKYT
jgi:MFS family permease